MSPVRKALWFVETHLSDPLSLADAATHCGVSAYHLTRAFAAVTGRPLMRYWRERRLSVAARSLAAGAPDILAVALDAGYGSHEAFTRAFRSQFSATPEEVRAAGSVFDLQLVEPLIMPSTEHPTLAPPARKRQERTLVVAGVSRHYSAAERGGIPAQWAAFAPSIPGLPDMVGPYAYGVCYNTDDEGGTDYLCGCAVSSTARVPGDWHVLRLPPRDYAVFLHEGHISDIGRTWGAVWSRGLAQAGLVPLDAPLFERYGPQFDALSGRGTVELWVPVGTEPGLDAAAT